MKRLYVDFHVLQTVPPSCVNRDDVGSPKTALYGGVTRARVSSQAWKKAMRDMFRETMSDPEKMGERTKKAADMIAERINAMGTLPQGKDAKEMARKALANIGIKVNEEDNQTETLLFISRPQAEALASLAFSGCADKKKYKEALKNSPSVDMVLFGRMVASDASLNFDAAAQVAHSISTHAARHEYDFFTAVDDLSPEDSSGAGHVGTGEFTSATLYRYATVNALELEKFFGPEETAKIIRDFADMFIRSMPGGKQNSFANRTLPDAVYVTIRRDQPVSLCGAFEQAVPSSTQGYVEESKNRLCDYAAHVYEDYTGDPVWAAAIGSGIEGLAKPTSLKKLLKELKAEVAQRLSREGE